MVAADREELRRRIDQAQRARQPPEPGLLDFLAGCEAAHGSEAGYALGCRCEPCRAASRQGRRSRRARPNVSIHGHSGYTSGCRCPACSAGNAAYMRAWRAARKQPAA